MRGQELTDSKREKLRDTGMTMLGSCAIMAWPDLLLKNFPYIFGPIAILWLILNFKTISRDILNAAVALGIVFWLILILVFRISN
jgi:small neutral amino acid transporter SnatA (MarC family)